MRKFLVVVACFFLSGCLTMPKYHDKAQMISFKLPEQTNLTIDGYELEANCVKVQRSFSALKGTLSKEGFEDKAIEIESQWTDDNWAAGENPVFGSKSAWTLLPPGRIIGFTVAGAMTPVTLAIFKNNPVWLLATPFAMVAGFICGVGTDIYNLIYGIPSVWIENPWYEYDAEVDLTREILVPTPEFERQCHMRINHFIGNHSCLPCLEKGAILATDAECGRCPNRRMENGLCEL